MTSFKPITGQPGKQYGLIYPKGKGKAAPKQLKSAVFDADDEEEEKPVTQQDIAKQLNQRRQHLVEQTQAKALEEDPTVFEYDELFDDMKGKQERATNQKLQKKEQMRKTAQYVPSLIAAASKRKIINDLAWERRMINEGKKEAEQYGEDKEKFITGDYIEHLNETQKIREEEARREKIEAINDVAKRGTMDGFIQNLLRDNVSMGGGPRDFSTRYAPKKDETEDGKNEKKRSAEDEDEHEEEERQKAKKRKLEEEAEKERIKKEKEADEIAYQERKQELKKKEEEKKKEEQEKAEKDKIERERKLAEYKQRYQQRKVPQP